MTGKFVQPPTLAEAVLDAWNGAMDDSSIPEAIKVKLACYFIGVPEMALHETKHLKVAWPHPVPATPHSSRKGQGDSSNEIA